MPVTPEQIARIFKTEIRDTDDELFAFGFIHFERMAGNQWWIGIDTVDGKYIAVWLTTPRAKIKSTMEVEAKSFVAAQLIIKALEPVHL